MGTLACVRPEGASVGALVRPWATAAAADAELVVAVPSDAGVAIGAYQRKADAPDVGLPVFRRASGGAAARLGPGSVFVRLALARVDALVPCAPDQLLNRYVRPLLAAIGEASRRPARYFGRDWIAVDGRPVAAVGFGHDAGAGSAVLEAVVAAEEPFAMSERASFRGKEPMALGVDAHRLARAIAGAYEAIAERTEIAPFDAEPAPPVGDDPPWQATREEAIGPVAAGRDAGGVMRVGGELMASRDAIGALEKAIADEHADVAREVDATLAATGVVVFGVRSLASIRDVIVACRR